MKRCFSILGLVFLECSLAVAASDPAPASLALEADAPAQASSDLSAALEAIRQKHHLPALAAASFTSQGILEEATVGLRKAGDDIPVTIDDLWLLGSTTKMMTAALFGTFVAEGKLSWNAKVASFFPEFSISKELQNVTLGQLLSHQAGLIRDISYPLYREKTRQGESLTDQRRDVVKWALGMPPTYPVGTFHYSNVGYVIIGAVLEKVSNKPWEQLIKERVFAPLKMTRAGVGAPAASGSIKQPWLHDRAGNPVPLTEPQVKGPVGFVHVSIADWVKFLSDQLRGAEGKPAFLPTAIYQQMQSVQARNAAGSGIASSALGYGYGWIIATREWAGGKALNHEGNNGVNLSECWIGPGKDFGVLFCTNGINQAGQASQEVLALLISRHQQAVKSAP